MFTLRACRQSFFPRSSVLFASLHSSAPVASKKSDIKVDEFVTPPPPVQADANSTLDAPPSPKDGGYPKPRPFTSKEISDKKEKVPVFGIYCNSTRNNTIVSVTKPEGGVLAWFSGGRCLFKGSNRNSYEAGYQCAKRSFEVLHDILKESPKAKFDLYFNGFGQGREAMRTALLTVEGERIRDHVRTVTDRTPIKIGGTRAKKARRL